MYFPQGPGVGTHMLLHFYAHLVYATASTMV